jgi:hypothetical protein
MSDSAAIRGSGTTSAGHSWIWELVLRALGAALQMAATWALIRALTPDEAGVFFSGFVIALGLSTVLRGKYEIYLAQHIIARRSFADGISDGALLMQLARRMLLRSSLVCAVLLVLTADLDIQAPQLQEVLQTYFPFVLALPFVSLSSLLGEALRAANRTLGIVITAYALNLSVLLVALLAPPDADLVVYSWAFLLGSIAAAAVATGLAWYAFPSTAADRRQPVSREILHEVDARELIALARGILLWGPLCVLAVWAPPLQMARYAVAARTAMIVDFFLPALNLTGCRETLRASAPADLSRRALVAQLAASFTYSSALVLPLLLFSSDTLRVFGEPYADQVMIYALLLAVQWANGAGRPAVRQAVIAWDARRIGVALGSGAVAVVLLCALGVAAYGATAAALASLIGAFIVNGRAIELALRDSAI